LGVHPQFSGTTNDILLVTYIMLSYFVTVPPSQGQIPFCLSQESSSSPSAHPSGTFIWSWSCSLAPSHPQPRPWGQRRSKQPGIQRFRGKTLGIHRDWMGFNEDSMGFNEDGIFSGIQSDITMNNG
jgi:hypothetical protein